MGDFSDLAGEFIGAEGTTPYYSVPDISAGFGDIASKAWQGVKGGVKDFFTSTDAAGKTSTPSQFGMLASGLNLGTSALGAYSGVKAAGQLAEQTRTAGRAEKLQEQTARQTAEAAAPLTQFGSQQLKQAEAGAIPPAIQAQIDSWIAGAKQQANDYFARAGGGDSQALVEWLAWIDQQGKAMAATYLQDEQALGVQGLTAGAQALGAAGAQAGGVGQTAGAQSQALIGLISGANQELAKLTASAA